MLRAFEGAERTSGRVYSVGKIQRKQERLHFGSRAGTILGVLCLLAFHSPLAYSGEQSTKSGGPAYATNVYPNPSRVARRVSEVTFEENAETSGYGFDTPFPDAPRITFKVEDYGAVADGVTDNTPAFKKALAAAKACGGPSEVLFGNTGYYLFRPENPDYNEIYSAILSIRDAKNVAICGQGDATVLVAGDPALGLMTISHCETIQLRNFSVDYNPLPFTQGTIAEVRPSESCFILAIDNGYPEPSVLLARDPRNTLDGYRMAEAAQGGIKWPPMREVGVESVKRMDDGRWRVGIDATVLSNLKTGDRFLYSARRLQQHALIVSMTRGFYAKNLVVHASVGVGLALTSVDGANIDGYCDAIPAGSDRLLASNADGTFSHGVRGGLTIRNCYYMGQGDDCINLHSQAFAPEDVTIVTDKEVRLRGLIEADIRNGDRLEIIDPRTVRVKGQIAITTAIPTNGAFEWLVQLRESLSSVDYSPSVDLIYPVELSSSNFKIVHNYFGQNRSRCMIIRARHGWIEGNTAENAEGYGVQLGWGGLEGVTAKNVTIRRNVFRNITNVGSAAAIEAADGSHFRNLSGMVIEGNRFINTRKMAISLTGVDGAKIIGNTVETDAGRRNTVNSRWYPVDCSVFLSNSRGIEIDQLSVIDPGIKEGVICVQGSCDPGAAGVSIGKVDAHVPKATTVVLDRRNPDSHAPAAAKSQDE